MPAEEATNRTVVDDRVEDPYKITADGIQEPPRAWRGRIRYLGPGLLISAAVVGSGELIATTALGAEAGFVLLWLVILSTAVKVWVQIELAQWTIVTGKPALTGYSRVGPKFGNLGLINWLWILMDLAKIFQRGGMIGGVAAACSVLLPLTGDSLSTQSLTVWTILVTVSIVALLFTNRYSTIERIAVAAVALFTVITIFLALGLPFTEFAYGGGDLATGLQFTIPAGTLGLAVAMFGITGIGAQEMTMYTYWCIEKGYARWTGPDDGSEARAQRAEGWLRVMRMDALTSWVVCTICTLSFYTIGAAVLHPQNLVPEGNEMITTLSHLYTDTMGDWGHYVFLVGAITVLYSTLINSTASVPRMWANTAGLLRIIDWDDFAVRRRVVRALTIAFPPVWGVGFLYIQSPVLMIQIGAIASGIFLLAVVIATWYLRTTEVDPRFRASQIFSTAFVISTIAIALLGVYTVMEVFGISVG